METEIWKLKVEREKLCCVAQKRGVEKRGMVVAEGRNILQGSLMRGRKREDTKSIFSESRDEYMERYRQRSREKTGAKSKEKRQTSPSNPDISPHGQQQKK